MNPKNSYNHSTDDSYKLSAEDILSERRSKNIKNYINNIYVLNLSKEDVAEFEKRQANVAKLKCTRTGSTSFFL